MKIRLGFVSNSSSSSFIVGYKAVGKKEIETIKNSCDFFIFKYDQLKAELKQIAMEEKGRLEKHEQDENLSCYDKFTRNWFYTVCYDSHTDVFKIFTSANVDGSGNELLGIIDKNSDGIVVWDAEPIDEFEINKKIWDQDYEYSDFNVKDFDSDIINTMQMLQKQGYKFIWDVGRDG